MCGPLLFQLYMLVASINAVLIFVCCEPQLALCAGASVSLTDRAHGTVNTWVCERDGGPA